MNTALSVTDDLPADPDLEAVTAVREGDRDRFRELVERHSAKVFAVAWCRLGDRDLAEEVTQESFVKAYRRLALLGNAERFGSWITTIARNAAINLGFRRRAELRKRERWALELPAFENNAPAEFEEKADSMGETLRETLAALPAIHRECLVLFYLERKSIAEAATALDLSESAFKTRLHRARAALREQMESRLEENLVRLRPSTGMLSAIMLALPAGKPVWSLATAIAAALSKLSAVGGLSFLLPILQAGPAVATQYWMGKKEIENLRDGQGLRAKNVLRMRNSGIVVVIVSIVAIAFINRLLDVKHLCQLFAVLACMYCAAGARQLVISRHRNVLATWMGTALLGLAFLGVGFLGWNAGMLAILQGVFFIFMSLMLDAQPFRTDLSPFLAAHSGDLAASDAGDSNPASPALATQEDLFAFARFLGARMVALDWRRGPDSLRLRLAPVTPSPSLGCIPILWGDASTVTLHGDGQVETHLGGPDRASLLALCPDSSVERDRLETAVGRATVKAFASVRTGNLAGAELELGAKPSSTVYHVEPKRTVLARTRKWALRVIGLLIIAEGIWISQMQRSIPAGQQAIPLPPPAPVQAKPAQIR